MQNLQVRPGLPQISIGNVFGCNQHREGRDRFNLVYGALCSAQILSTFLNSHPGGQGLTGHRSPGHQAHHTSSSLNHWKCLIDRNFFLNMKKWSKISSSTLFSVCPLCPIVTLVCFSLLTGAAAQAQGEWTGAGSEAGAGTWSQELGSSQWNVVAGKSINLFFDGSGERGADMSQLELELWDS